MLSTFKILNTLISIFLWVEEARTHNHQNTFHYLNQGSSPDVTGVNDLDSFEETVNALNLLGFSETEQNDMFKILASVLHLGNINFLECIIETENEQDQEGCGIKSTDKHMRVLSELLEIDEEEMRQWLCTRKLVSMREIFMKPMTVEEAAVSRDALAKHIYAELFNWIVLVINKALETGTPRHKFIGVLDIYGFETFEINSFEQFCINYANEKLQQQFNLHVFKLEQEEYIKEGRFGTSAFVINHFADKVQYESNGFLEKNRDTVIEEQINVVKASKNNLVKRLFASESQKLAAPGTKLKIIAAKPAPVSHKTHKKSVGSQFRDSLNMLMSTLNATTPHYVRCIKPNDTKTAFEFNSKRAVQQLRACGVLETIRISSAGFPKNCQIVYMEEEIFENKKNRHFFYNDMEEVFWQGGILYIVANDLRRERAAKTIQRYVRGWVKRVQYERLRQCVTDIQRYSRGYLARLRFLNLKDNAKATAVRRFLARRQYKKLRIEARSIEHVKKLNKGLENKIISLQQRIDELNKTNNERKNYQNEVHELKNKMVAFKAMEIEIKNLNNLLIDKNKIITKLQEEIKTERDEKIDLVNEHEKYRLETENQRDLWAQETAKLRKELENINEIVKMNEKGAEENLKVRLEEEKMMMLNDADSDREAYQKLLQEYHCLEQHCEELKQQLHSHNHLSFHRRNISDISSISTVDENLLNSDIPEDHGYGSVRSTTSNSSHTREKLENIDWKIGDATSDSQTPSTNSSSEANTKHETENKVDVGLVLKLQHKLAEVEREKMRMQKRLDEIDMSPRTEKAKNEAENAVKISELELCNSQLKSQLFELQNSINEGTGLSKLHEQLQTLQHEIDRRSEEIVQLKSVLANQTNNMRSILNSKTRTGEYINEDGELAQAYETQKTINKQLELELQDEKSKFKAHEREYKLEIEKLREDNERQQRILSANLTTTPQSQGEAFMQHEITRLTTENLDLLDKNDTLTESVRKLKKFVKLLTKKLKDAGLDLDDTVIIENDTNANTKAPVPPSRAVPTIRKKEREYLGMFSFRTGDENLVMKQLVIELKPRTAVALLPGLPAYIIFMCIRHTDYINDEDKVKTLLSAFTNSVKKVIRKRHEDFETTTLWLSNTLRLLHNMKQYSGDKAFQKKNTAKQNEQCLRNFDLSEYRQVLSDIAVWIYQGLIKNFEEKIQPLIVPAILEHEEIPGISGNKPSGFRGRTSSLARELDSPVTSQKPTHALLQELTNHHKILTFYGVDPEVISQVFKQVFYFLCASSLNNLLLRKELCHWSKGFQIRHNLSHFEMWTREKNLDEAAIQGTLQPIIQAAHLLQARKTEEDVASVCEMCSHLTPLQICKILNLYTPVDEFEQRVPVSFIRKVQAKLQERPQSQEQQTLLMDVKYNFPVRFPFNPSIICLEDIEIPDSLKLPMLEKL
ncbi:hypothetical protein NQ314_003568 [Rhamnusium bicolor]|uniref:Unconventional myosin-Va n=1 Tax=Rhamnusium bicolor TaxID=1586634 RepID=A0AAV8ZPQ8_9CUCU|nr:hypothetical protein NQ314_003568 [Rhamnusium bicolor]